MRPTFIVPAVFVFALMAHAARPPAPVGAPPPGIRLGDLPWPDAEARLGADAVVVIPLGAAAEQHGPHLTLANDARMADYLVQRILEIADVVVLPSLAYHYSPSFEEYPGSTSLSLNTARDLTADVARSLARHGPRRFYVLNTGISTMEALEEAARVLATDGLLLRFTDLPARLAAARVAERQPVGNHADEIETSMMLYLDPSSVDMTRAAREVAPASSPFRLTRRPGGPGTYSPTGVWGDATAATPEKGRALVEALVTGIRADIESLRQASLPATPPANAPAGRAMARPGDRRTNAGRRPDECLPGDDRAIRGIGPAFSIAWRNQDAARLAAFWAPEGDMVHPDGFIEGSAQTIRQNRASLFMRSEYKDSRHPLILGQIRCLGADVAIADGKWELAGLADANGQAVPPIEGLCTLVLNRSEGAWRIEAYRYTIDPQKTSAPTLLPRPGRVP